MKRTILITAYAVNPYKGSEDGIGWNIIKGAAARNDVVAITRVNNGTDIEKYLSENPLSKNHQLRFEYFDLPYWLRFWKKGSRGSSIYHILWHFGVVFFILKKHIRFDLAHHLNFNADWSPSFLYLLGKPFIWGPVGHHHKIPKSYILPHGKKAWLKDRAMWWVKSYFWKIDPFLFLTRSSARKIIGLNTSVFKVMKVAEHKQVIVPASGNDLPAIQAVKKGKQFKALSVGRFVPLKGFDLTLRAFAKCYHSQPTEVQKNMQLTLIGKGPEKERLKILAEKLKLENSSVHFVEWLNRDELDRYFSESSTFIFPSHEGAGMVIPEALSFGLPVVVFDNYGPGELAGKNCGIKIPYTTYEQSIDDFSEAIEALMKDEKRREDLSKNAREFFLEKYTWEGKAQEIQKIYEEIFLEKESATTPSLSTLKT